MQFCRSNNITIAKNSIAKLTETLFCEWMHLLSNWNLLVLCCLIRWTLFWTFLTWVYRSVKCVINTLSIRKLVIQKLMSLFLKCCGFDKYFPMSFHSRSDLSVQLMFKRNCWAMYVLIGQIGWQIVNAVFTIS
jgi:hypothetical protein